jgi:hypothetical protein
MSRAILPAKGNLMTVIRSPYSRSSSLVLRIFKFGVLIAGLMHGPHIVAAAKTTAVAASKTTAVAGEQTRSEGIGIGVGSLSGISGYYRLSAEKFTQGLLGFSKNSLMLTCDYNTLIPNFLDNFHGIHAYYGVGGLVNTDEGLGVRVPLGILWRHDKHPLQLSAEIVPALLVIPETHALLDLTVALRYIFGVNK